MHNYGFPFNFSLFILDNSKFLNSKRFFLLLCVYIIFITWKVHNQKTDIKIKNRAVLLLWIYRLWAIILHFGEYEKKTFLIFSIIPFIFILNFNLFNIFRQPLWTRRCQSSSTPCSWRARSRLTGRASTRLPSRWIFWMLMTMPPSLMRLCIRQLFRAQRSTGMLSYFCRLLYLL